jgi:hypothetical protein
VEDPDHQHRLAGARVELHLGAALQEDQRLANCLEQVVRGQQQERRERHQRDERDLVRLDPAEGAERARETAA